MTKGDQYLATIREAIGKPTERLSMIDLCCGEMTMTRHLKFRKSLHTDIIDYPNRPQGFNFLPADVFWILSDTHDKEFDVCLCLDAIEHFTRDDGFRLLTEMERIAKLQIIFTPLGSMWVNDSDDQPYGHKSGWLPDEFTAMKWNTMVFPKWHEEWGFGAFFAWKGKV